MDDNDAPGGAAELLLFGYCGDDWDEQGFTARGVVKALSGLGDVLVRVNSGGGSAFEGAAIYAILKAHAGRVTVRVEGVAASAASLIAMAGAEIVMAEGAMMMIHDPSGITIGPAAAHQKSAEDLNKIAENYAAVYAARSGQDQAAVRALMLAETWFTAAEAVDAGFADRAAQDASEAVAAFDFTVYARAPEHLRAMAVEKGWRLRQPDPGASAPVHKELNMSTTKNTAAQPDAAVNSPAEAAQQSAEMRAASDAEIAREAAESRRRKAVVARFGEKLTAQQADTIAAGSRDEAEALVKAADIVIEARMAAEGPELRQTAHITRDERETLRDGIEGAIFAQLGRSEPDGKARPYMEMSLVEMAAAAIGHKGSLRHTAARERVLMAATHTRSDFPAIFENALNKQLAARYREAKPTYRQIARRMTFNDFRPHPITRVGDWPTLLPVAESGEIKYGTVGEGRETVAAASYAVAMRISRQMLIDDDLDALAQVVADRGLAVARFEDATFYAMMLSGSNADGPTLATTTRQVFNTTDLSKASSNAAISETSLGIARASLRKRTSLDGAKLNIIGSILLTGPDKELEAQRLVAPIQAAASNNVNPFTGTLQVVTTAEIAGNTWYLFASPADLACFVYGFLSGYEAPRMRMDEPFGQQGIAYSVEHDFGVGAIDFRGGFKNVGA